MESTQSIGNRSGAGSNLPVTLGQLSDFPDDPIACMSRLHQSHGDLAALEQDGQRIVFVFGPDWNQRVLSDPKTFHSRFFAVRGPRHSSQRRVSWGLLSMNGSEHKEHRRMVMEPFQKKALPQYHAAVCQMTEAMLDRWQVGHVHDLREEMTQYLLRVTSGLLFGIDVPEIAFQLGAMIDRWVQMNHKTGIGAFVSDVRFNRDYGELLTLAEQLEQDIQRLIDLRRSTNARGTDVLSLLLQAYDHDARINQDELIGHIALLFGAAHLTTAHAFAWTLFLLAQHPPVMRDLFCEISGAFRGSAPVPDDLPRMPLTERVIKESMRILPPSAYSQRIAAEPVRLGPMQLSRGTPVVFSQFITHHKPELFAQPQAFLPDRWLKITPSPYAYFPFGAGPRMCVGAGLAMMILKTALPMILKRYRLSMVAGAEVSGKVISTMLGPATGMPMLVSEPDGKFESQPVTGNIHSMVELAEAAVPNQKAA